MPIKNSSMLSYQSSCEPLATNSSALKSKSKSKSTATPTPTPTNYSLRSSLTLIKALARKSSEKYLTHLSPWDESNESGMPLHQGVVDVKNQALTSEEISKYICPEANSHYDIGPPELNQLRMDHRVALRPEPHQFVTLNFRVMRHDAEMHISHIINNSGGKIKRADLYSPLILDKWTQRLKVKIKAKVKVSLVFSSISARLGLQCNVGLKFCLDGFYGIEAYGDAFGNYGPGICPWMEVCGEGTPLSLKLENGDNIYMSVATERMMEAVRRRIQHIVSPKANKEESHVARFVEDSKYLAAY